MTTRRHDDAHERRHVSLPPVLSRAADALAEREGRRFSNLIQELVRKESDKVFGPNWADLFTDEGRDAA